MSTSRHHPRGVTLVELAVVIAIVGILAAIASSSFSRQRPRANLANAAAELQGLTHAARQTALATGHDVALLVFPDFANRNRSTGRFVLYEDAFYDFFTGGATGGVTFSTYDAGVLKYGSNGSARSAVLETMDTPSGVDVGPTTGMGASATLAAPLANLPVNVACSFCDASGPNRRGAIVFDSHGQATFYNGAGKVDLTGKSGASLSLEAPDVSGQRTLIITSPGGALRTLIGG